MLSSIRSYPFWKYLHIQILSQIKNIAEKRSRLTPLLLYDYDKSIYGVLCLTPDSSFIIFRNFICRIYLSLFRISTISFLDSASYWAVYFEEVVESISVTEWRYLIRSLHLILIIRFWPGRYKSLWRRTGNKPIALLFRQQEFLHKMRGLSFYNPPIWSIFTYNPIVLSNHKSPRETTPLRSVSLITCYSLLCFLLFRLTFGKIPAPEFLVMLESYASAVFRF